MSPYNYSVLCLNQGPSLKVKGGQPNNFTISEIESLHGFMRDIINSNWWSDSLFVKADDIVYQKTDIGDVLRAT